MWGARGCERSREEAACNPTTQPGMFSPSPPRKLPGEMETRANRQDRMSARLFKPPGIRQLLFLSSPHISFVRAFLSPIPKVYRQYSLFPFSTVCTTYTRTTCFLPVVFARGATTTVGSFVQRFVEVPLIISLCSVVRSRDMRRYYSSDQCVS